MRRVLPIWAKIAGDFDRDFYLARNPDVAASGMDAADRRAAERRFSSGDPLTMLALNGVMLNSHRYMLAAAGIDTDVLLRLFSTVGTAADTVADAVLVAIASAPDEHADTGVMTPARAPSSRPATAAAPLGMII